MNPTVSAHSDSYGDDSVTYVGRRRVADGVSATSNNGVRASSDLDICNNAGGEGDSAEKSSGDGETHAVEFWFVLLGLLRKYKFGLK